ncbi:MAG: phytoene desaturase family protein [Anaerolineaceae bacterium]
MKEKTIIIIGAGITGLAAGAYGQMNGYKTRIFELGSLPGGLCTTWKRKGFSFDGCIHWLMGSNPDSAYNRLWQELGAAKGREFVNHEYFMEVNAPSGRKVYLYTNIDRLEKHLLEVGPEDQKLIREITGDLRKFTKMEMPLDGSGNFFKNLIAYLPMFMLMGKFRKWSAINMQMLAGKFKNADLRYLFQTVFNLPDMPAIGLFVTLAGMHNKDSGYPIGGSLPFSQAIENRYLSLGGEINYNARVSKVLVENGCAVGVRLADGREFRADIIVSAADGHSTIFEMLDGKFINNKIAGYYREMPIFQGIVQVSLGINRELKDAPHSLIQNFKTPVSIGGEQQKTINTRIFNYDPTMAPAGKTVAQTFFASNYNFWKEIAGDRERYEAEKQRAAVTFIDHLEESYPGITGQIEAVDISTPLTTERYTGNWQGSIEGWLITRKTIGMMFGKGMEKTLPGLKNFYMAGQWVEPGGGIPTAGMAGRKLISGLCKQNRKPFITTIA